VNENAIVPTDRLTVGGDRVSRSNIRCRSDAVRANRGGVFFLTTSSAPASAPLIGLVGFRRQGRTVPQRRGTWPDRRQDRTKTTIPTIIDFLKKRSEVRREDRRMKPGARRAGTPVSSRDDARPRSTLPNDGSATPISSAAIQAGRQGGWCVEENRGRRKIAGVRAVRHIRLVQPSRDVTGCAPPTSARRSSELSWPWHGASQLVSKGNCARSRSRLRR